MSEELFLDKGSKRRVRRIRWKMDELTSVFLLGLGIAALILATAFWMMDHPID